MKRKEKKRKEKLVKVPLANKNANIKNLTNYKKKLINNVNLMCAGNLWLDKKKK